MTDFWPTGIALDDTQTPKDILDEAAEQWREKSGGVLSLMIRNAKSTDGDALLVVHGVHEPTNRTINLFTVAHRANSLYPVAIQLKKHELPNYLKKSYYEPGLSPVITFGQAVRAVSEGRMVENDWVAESPSEFRNLLKQAFNFGSVKADITALLAGSAKREGAAGTEGHSGETTDAPETTK